MKQEKQEQEQEHNVKNKNPTRFYYKEEIKQSYDKKMYPRLVLNRPKVMRIFASIYTHWAHN
jgi:hypothetical protein